MIKCKLQGDNTSCAKVNNNGQYSFDVNAFKYSCKKTGAVTLLIILYKMMEIIPLKFEGNPSYGDAQRACNQVITAFTGAVDGVYLQVERIHSPNLLVVI